MARWIARKASEIFRQALFSSEELFRQLRTDSVLPDASETLL